MKKPRRRKREADPTPRRRFLHIAGGSSAALAGAGFGLCGRSSASPPDASGDGVFRYKGVPVLASPAAVRTVGKVKVEIGPPEIVAAKDESPDEGTFVAPRLRRLGNSIYLNWSFDWDVVDSHMPDTPNGRVSHDGGLTWEKQKLLMPPGEMYQTDDRDVGCWFRGFEVPGEPGVFKVATWWSSDVGRTWRGHSWTTVRYPGAKGMDTYDPPEEFRKQDGNYLRGGVKPSPPAHLEPFFKEVSRLTPLVHQAVCPQAEGPDGTLYSMTYGRYVQNTAGIEDWDRQYWQRLNWYRYAVLMQVSRDRGRTWEFAGVPADGSDYEPRIDVKPGGNVYSRDFFVANPPDQLGAGFKGRVDFQPGDGFSEPSLVIFPDGEMLCALRTGSNKPLYSIRSHDGGRTWTKAELLSPRSVTPICGVLPKLVLLENEVLALFTGRPDCTFHFSTDRGRTWFPKETLFSMTSIPFDGLYSASHCNNSMIAVGDDTLLLVHDATRPDPSAPNPWLQKAGHGIIIARRITIHA